MENVFDGALQGIHEREDSTAAEAKACDRLDVESVGCGMGKDADGTNFLLRRLGFRVAVVCFPKSRAQAQGEAFVFASFVATVDLHETGGWNERERQKCILAGADDCFAHSRHIAIRS